jgi:hypothetical protein
MMNSNDIETRLSRLRPVSQDELAERILRVPCRVRQDRQRRREKMIALGGVLTGTVAGAVIGTVATFLLMTLPSVPQVEVRENIRENVREVAIEVPAPKAKPEPVDISPLSIKVKPINLDEMIAKQEALAKRAQMFVNTPVYPLYFHRDEPVTNSPMEYRNLLKEITQ